MNWILPSRRHGRLEQAIEGKPDGAVFGSRDLLLCISCCKSHSTVEQQQSRHETTELILPSSLMLRNAKHAIDTKSRSSRVEYVLCVCILVYPCLWLQRTALAALDVPPREYWTWSYVRTHVAFSQRTPQSRRKGANSTEHCPTARALAAVCKFGTIEF